MPDNYIKMRAALPDHPKPIDEQPKGATLP